MSQRSRTIGSTRASFIVAGRNGGVNTTISTSNGFWTNQRRRCGTTASMMTKLAANIAQMHQSRTAARASQVLPRSDSCKTMVGMASSAATISGTRSRCATRSARKAACVSVAVLPCVPVPCPLDIPQTPPLL